VRIYSVPPYGFFAHAHSIFFNLLSETGMVGVAAFAVLAIATFVALWRQVNVLTGHDRAVAIAALAGAAAWAAHSIVDTVNVEPMNSVLITVLLGAALGGWLPTQTANAEKQTSVLKPVEAWWPVGLGIVLSITGIYSVWRMTPMYEGLVASVKQQWPQTSASFAEAVNRDADNPIAHQQAGLAYSLLAQQAASGALETAIAEFETVTTVDPDWWLNHANLAALYAARGDTQAALEEYRLAYAVGKGSPILLLNYGMAAEVVESNDEAGQAYMQLLNWRPGLADAYFWRSNAFRQDVLKSWRAVASSRQVLTFTQMQALATGGDRASDYTPLAAEYIRLGRFDEAEILLKKAKLAYFDSGDAKLEADWLNAALAAGRGDFPAAAKLGEDAINNYFLQSALGPGTFGAAAYGQVFFRQSTMAIDLVPQLVGIPLTDTWANRFVQVGDWYSAAGEPEKAELIYQQVLSLVPDNAPAQERLNQSP
jgi:tetratricopeptide (TPR) repeat protein